MAVRPPRTLVQQNVVINNVNVNKNVTNVRVNQPLVALNQVKQQGNVRLQAVTGPRLEAEKLNVKSIQSTSAQRVKAEQAVVVRGAAPVRLNDTLHAIKHDMPPQRPAVTVQTKVVVPPVPTGSRPKDRPDPNTNPNDRPDPNTRPKDRPDPNRGQQGR